MGRSQFISSLGNIATSPLTAHAQQMWSDFSEQWPWMRFNVSACETTRVQRWLQRQAATKAA
jgi:hypothetical protein